MKELAHAALLFYIRKFPLRKGKLRLLSLLWKPLSFNRYRRSAHLRQAPIEIECDISKVVQRQLYFFGSYEDENTDYWIERTRDARTIFDVGANVGLYSLLSAAVNPQADIHGFEPTPEIFDAFTNNIQRNNFGNITANKAAVGNKDGTVFLQVRTGADGNNEGMNFVDSKRHGAKDVEVPSLTLDGYCEKKGIQHIDLLKIDIEGGEYNALLGSQRLLEKKAIRCIFLELIEWAANRSGTSTVEIKRYLASMGYQMFLLESGRLQPIRLEGAHSGDNIIALAHGPESATQASAGKARSGVAG